MSADLTANYIYFGVALLSILLLLLFIRTCKRKKKDAGDAPSDSKSPAFAAPEDLPPTGREAMGGSSADRGQGDDSAPKAISKDGPDKALEELLIWHPLALRLAECPCCGVEYPADSQKPCEVCGRKRG